MSSTELSTTEKYYLQIKNLNTELAEAEDKYNNALAIKEDRIKSGAIGFFNYLYKTQKDDTAKTAIDVLTGKNSCDAKPIQFYENLYVPYDKVVTATYPYNTYETNINNASDSLQSMRESVQLFEKYYYYFEKDDFTSEMKYKPAKINNILIAQAQLECNYYRKHRIAPILFDSSRHPIRKASSIDPFDIWYFKSKYEYEKRTIDRIQRSVRCR